MRRYYVAVKLALDHGYPLIRRGSAVAVLLDNPAFFILDYEFGTPGQEQAFP